MSVANKETMHNDSTFACASDQAAMMTPIVNRTTEMTCRREYRFPNK